jgi:hypothetical protein
MVDRNHLWAKLMSQGISGRVLRIVQGIYGKAKSCVRVGGCFSDFFVSNVGVRQGENLSPLLFSLFVNDFAQVFSNVYDGLSTITDSILSELDVYLSLYVLLYADDTLILAENEEGLQSALDCASEYCRKWGITINPQKSKVVVFSRGKIRKLPEFKLNDKILGISFDFNYLGVNLNYNNTFKKAIAKQVNQAMRAMQALRVKIERLDLHYDLQWHLFNHTVAPILLYGSEVWAFESCDMIDVFHRKFMKQQLRLNRSTPNCMVYGESGQIKLSLNAECRMLSFWFRIAYSNGRNRFTSILLKLMNKLHSEMIIDFKWGSRVKSLLDTYGFGGLWIPENNPGVLLAWFKRAIALRMTDVFKQTWEAEVWDKTSCVNYRIFKTSHEIETTLLRLDKKHSQIIYKFRCANFPLPVHKNRYNLQLNTNCHLCNAELGDEFHYLLTCTALDEARRQFIPRRYYIRPNANKFRELMTSNKVSVMRALAKFLILVRKKCDL